MNKIPEQLEDFIWQMSFTPIFGQVLDKSKQLCLGLFVTFRISPTALETLQELRLLAVIKIPGQLLDQIADVASSDVVSIGL